MNFQEALFKAQNGFKVTHPDFDGYMTGKGMNEDGNEGYVRSKVNPVEYEDYEPTPEDEAADWSLI